MINDDFVGEILSKLWEYKNNDASRKKCYRYICFGKKGQNV